MPSLVDFRKVSRQHLRDARVLFKAKRYNGATYLCGYAVEIALKVRIAKTLGWATYPDSEGSKGKYRSFIRHDLEVLLELSGRESKVRSSPALTAHWSHVSKWDPEMRYVLPAPQITKASVAINARTLADLVMTIDYEPFVAAAHDIAAERGEFAIFVLILREDMAAVMSTSSSVPSNVARWDVLLSAPWLAADRRAPLEYVAAKIEKHGGKAALRSIARLNAVPVSDPIVKRIMNELQVPRPLTRGVQGAGGVHLLNPSVIGPGVSQAIAVTASANERAARAR
jgi:hypothetical protein